MRLEHPQFGWKALQNVLNKIVDAVNANVPVEGSGIRVSDGAGGKIIEVVSGGGGAAADGTGKKPTTITWAGVKWKDVTIVDPSTCAQEDIKVLIKTDVPGDFVVISPTIIPSSGSAIP